MKQNDWVLMWAAVALSGACFAQTARPALADLSDPLVGTDSKFELSRGNTYPGVFRPFGMLAWTAQTGEGGWPYQYEKNRIQGFLATHRPSAWTDDYGPFSLMPVSGDLKLLNSDRGAAFRHENEQARAYRYSVKFDNGLSAEMTATARGGLLRFAFPKNATAYVVVDAKAGGSAVAIDAGKSAITGSNSQIRGNFPAGFAQYFVIVFDRKFAAHGTWDQSGAKYENTSRQGKHVGAYVQFAPGETVTARVAISLISQEQAWLNLRNEVPVSYEKAVTEARDEWNRELGRIELAGGTEAERRTFYTGLYHAYQTPHALHEVDASGKQVHYSPYDGRVHDGPLYADNGFWDTFRAQFPLLALIQPKRDADIIRGLLSAADEGGWIPKWPNPGYSNVMIGTHGDSVIADAYIKGVRGFDAQKAYASLRRDATEPGTGRYQARNGILDYIRLGYVPADKVHESVACTLEYAYDDFCVAQMARALGKDDDYKRFTAQSKNYRNMFDKETRFMRGRNSDGQWLTPFDPLAWGGVYTEGNAWQWLWSVQHDVPGLMELLGGKEAFTARLDELFSMTSDFHVGGYGKVIHEMTEAKMAGTGQYAHINEPVHHVIYLYNYAGQPWKAQKWTREIMDRFYKPGPSGWLGDEDTGQMSSWYIFSSMGFYPVNPGQPVYALGSPLFNRVAVHLENGKTFTVTAERANPSSVYVQAAWLNGKPIDRAWITHAEILAGGTLKFRLGAEPNKQWGTSGLPAVQ